VTGLDLAALQEHAVADGRRVVVGALVLDPAGRVLVQRRSADRVLFPGCWDLIGGHVEAGETLLDALAREVEEESGWRLGTGEPRLAYAGDWEAGGDPRREFDFVVEVDGDLSRPRLEPGKQEEFRWIGEGELDVLNENRGLDDGLVRAVVEAALRYGLRVPALPHATIFLGLDAAGPFDAVRAYWDPAMAAQIGAHVTAVYPGELAELSEVLERVAVAASETPPFRLRLGTVGCEEGWVFVAAEDIDGAFHAFRRAVLGPAATDGRPHVTLVHPRTTNRGAVACEELLGTASDAELDVREIAVTAFDGRTWPAVERFELSG
jgi:8-oxo-dGTP diphosphatase